LTHRPRVFIGSSGEAAEIAETLGELLDRTTEPKVWTQGFFEPGVGTLESLLDTTRKFDFAVLIMSGDDTIEARGSTQAAPRDNVVFELGLFIGALGRSRTFMFYNEDRPPKVPSDLLGITAITYRDHTDGNLSSALGSAANKLRRRFKELGEITFSQFASPERSPRIYWCAPHHNITRNKEAVSFLEREGIAVHLPYELVNRELGVKKQAPALVRQICSSAIANSDFVVVDLDTYGLDSAWEIGFAEGTGKRIIGVSRGNEGTSLRPRSVHNRIYSENFMHGWDGNVVDANLDALAHLCEGRVVHVCGPFQNDAAMEELRTSAIARTASELILPRDELDWGNTLPPDLAWTARGEAIRLLDRAGVALVVLPRYGMDTSWQLGYATGRHKMIIGWLTADSNRQFDEAQIWDHWMHGWRQKPHLTTMVDLAAIIRGLQYTELRQPSEVPL